MKTNEVHESHNVAQKKPFEAGEKEGTLTNSLVEGSSEGPDSGQLRQLQVAADASAQVHQLRTLQLAANHSPQVKQSAQLKEKATEFSRGALQNKEDRSGLPAQLKAGIEGLSGMALDDVRLRNSKLLHLPKGTIFIWVPDKNSILLMKRGTWCSNVKVGSSPRLKQVGNRSMMMSVWSRKQMSWVPKRPKCAWI